MLANFKHKFIGDKAFYKRYIFLAAPMIAQNAISNFVSFLDNFMVGQLGPEAISAVATVNQLIFVFALAVFGAASAGSIYGAQYFGKGDHKGHMYTFRFKLYATILVTIIGIGIFLMKGSTLVSLFLTDAGNMSRELALDFGMKYASIILVGLVPFAVTQAYATNIKETGQTVVPMVAGMFAVGINAILDYLLIFGKGPFPEMGVEGAAIATVIARYIEAAIVIIWAHTHRDANKYLVGAFKGIGLPKDILGSIIIKGVPIMVNEVLWAAGVSVVTQSYSVRGMNVLTALSISNNVANLFNIVFIQLGACISIVVGQYLGAGELEEAKDADNKMIFFSVACCTVMALLMFLCGGLLPQFFNVPADVRSLATKLIAVSALWMPFCSFSHCAYFTLRSGGKTLITFLFDSVFTWIIMAPLAFVLVRYTSLGIVMVYLIVQGTELIKNVLGYFMVKSNAWLVKMV